MSQDKTPITQEEIIEGLKQEMKNNLKHNPDFKKKIGEWLRKKIGAEND